MLRFLLPLLAAAAPAAAQMLYGSLSGRVSDESQSLIAGADVAAVNDETNLTRKVKANEEGIYSIPNLPPGAYTVTITMAGFAEFKRAGVALAPNSVVRVDAVMRLAGVQSTVVVTGDTEIATLQTDRSDVRRELNSRQFADLPVSLAGNYQSLLQTLPGFESDADMRPTRMGGCNPSGSVGFSVNGATTSTTVTNVDGASNSHIWNVGRSAVVPTIDSIESVNVTTNSFDAEQGLAGGAVINVQSKGGTNQFHGSAFEYHYNQAVRARQFFLPAGQNKAKYISNRYGATLGGPILRDKLFFFASYGVRSERDNGGNTFSLPGTTVRTGDFSGFTSLVYDPLTGSPDGSERTPFADNRLPASRMDPIARKILGLVPATNLPGLEDTNANNFFSSQPFGADRWSLDTKVNWQALSSLNAFVSWNYADHQSLHITAFGDGFIDGPRVGGGNAGNTWGYNNRISAGATYVFSPTTLMDAFAGWTRQNTNVEQLGIGTNFGAEFLGIPGTNGPNRFQSGWPKFAVAGFAAFGTEEAYTPYYRNDNQYSFRTNFTRTSGAHEIRWGADVNSEQMNHIQPEFQGGDAAGARGTFDFSAGITANCNVPDGRGGCRTVSATTAAANSMASFLLGLPFEVSKNSLNFFPYTTRTWRYAFYLRDRWQVSRALTLNIGVRWEYMPTPTRADRGLERYNPDDNQMYIGGVGNVPRDLGVKSSKRLFAPRFGFAWRLSPDSVLRGGYGISWDPYSLARALRTNHPILTELVVTSPSTLFPARRLAEGIPPITPPSLGNGIIPAPPNVSVQTVPSDIHRGYIQSWNLTYQRRLGGGWIGEAGYVATRQTRQLGYRQVNWSPIGGGNNGRVLFRQFGRTADTREVGPVGGSHYDSLQAMAQRRFANGYSLTAAYTFGKSISGSGLDRSDSTLRIVIPEYYGLNRSLSALVRKHNLQVTNLFSLPFGRNQRWFNQNGVLSAILGNWPANSIVSLMAGRPFSVTSSGTSLNAPGNTQRADQVKASVARPGGIGRGASFFDPLAYAQVNDARFGNSAFNTLTGPGRVNWDFGLFRFFRLKERFRMELRAEAFNFTNTPKFGQPGANVSNLQFNPDGTIRNLNGFTEIVTATEERQFSVMLRLSF
ncbi:MAG: hypothetical protein FJW39_11655 [Acidobacteria bacterium]|nr:hypothetical protein [Acidobacteriota bacterium]